MVRGMLALLACLLPLTVWGGLQMQTDKRELALGEALTLTVNGPVNALEALDVISLEQDFEIRARNLSHGERDGILTLTLYPLHAGLISLPGLSSTTGHTRPIPVRVLEESQNIPRVRWRAELEPVEPLVRQPVRFTLEACDDGSLEWKRPALPTLEAVQVRTLGEEQLDVKRDGATCTAHRWHWALLPLAAGAASVPLPMLEAGKFGQSLRFPPPEAKWVARPIPAWLPQQTAIGRPVIQAAPLPGKWPLERPLAWRLEIDGAYSSSDIKSLLRSQLAAYPAFAAYPPTVETLPQGDPASPRTRLAVTVYALPQATGKLAFPDLVFPYLDPASEQMETLRLSGGRMEVFNPLHEKLWRTGGGLLVTILLVVAGWRLKQALDWRRARRHGLAAIAAAGNVGELANALRHFSLRANAQPATTLGQWCIRMKSETKIPNMAALLETVEQACYGEPKDRQRGLGLDELKRQAVAALRKTSPRQASRQEGQTF